MTTGKCRKKPTSLHLITYALVRLDCDQISSIARLTRSSKISFVSIFHNIQLSPIRASYKPIRFILPHYHMISLPYLITMEHYHIFDVFDNEFKERYHNGKLVIAQWKESLFKPKEFILNFPAFSHKQAVMFHE